MIENILLNIPYSTYEKADNLSTKKAALILCNVCYNKAFGLLLHLLYKLIPLTTHQILVENIKCSGCINTIKTNLCKINGVTAVKVYLEKAKVCVTGIAIEREEMVNKLALMGYPEKGNNNLLSRAKSYIS
ncbi:MAG TPA: heavy metal-associated domain-containing protein, partial [Ferruginibacter sp.]|nr:heavy metal-associated domain-containing protein [Ferruginibacter sp.]